MRRQLITMALGWSLFGGGAVVRADGPARPRELRWGVDSQGGAPYAFQNPMDPNHLIGFEVELADAIAARPGRRGGR